MAGKVDTACAKERLQAASERLQPLCMVSELISPGFLLGVAVTTVIAVRPVRRILFAMVRRVITGPNKN
jgi:hypothetical protein